MPERIPVKMLVGRNKPSLSSEVLSGFQGLALDSAGGCTALGGKDGHKQCLRFSLILLPCSHLLGPWVPSKISGVLLSACILVTTCLPQPELYEEIEKTIELEIFQRIKGCLPQMRSTKLSNVQIAHEHK